MASGWNVLNPHGYSHAMSDKPWKGLKRSENKRYRSEIDLRKLRWNCGISKFGNLLLKGPLFSIQYPNRLSNMKWRLHVQTRQPQHPKFNLHLTNDDHVASVQDIQAECLRQKVDIFVFPGCFTSCFSALTPPNGCQHSMPTLMKVKAMGRKRTPWQILEMQCFQDTFVWIFVCLLFV